MRCLSHPWVVRTAGHDGRGNWQSILRRLELVELALAELDASKFKFDKVILVEVGMCVVPGDSSVVGPQPWLTKSDLDRYYTSHPSPRSTAA
jgi:hypothetical protein